MTTSPFGKRIPAADAGIGFKDTQTLQKIEERLRSAAQADNAFSYVWDSATDAVLIPGECALLLGVGMAAHVTGRLVLSRIHPGDLERVGAAFAGLVRESPYVQASYRILHPERGEVWLETNSGALFDEAGKILRITGTVADITARRLAEIELALVNDRLQLAMSAGKSVGWEWDVRSGRDFWFGDLQTIFGIPSKTYVGQVDDFSRRVHPADRALVWEAVQGAMKSQTPYVAEYRIIREDGTVRWVAAQGKFYYLTDGEPERMLGIAVDITERKAVEEALHRKDLELTEAQRLAKLGSWRWDPDTDTVMWSDELYRIAGRDPRLPAVSYGEHPQLFTPESWERLSHAVEEALRTGEEYELELEMIHSDGSTRWVIARGQAQKDSGGRIAGLNGTVQDITRRRRSREALRESEERLRLAAQAGRMYAYEWDKASDVIVRSAEFTPVLGLANEPKDMTCHQIQATVHPDDRAKVIAATNGCTPESPACRVQYRVLRTDGSVIWLEKNGHAFFDGKGEMVRMIGMVADITERKLAEEAISGMSRRLIEAQEAERARIARDLHDDVGQRLAMLSVMVEQIKRALPDSEGDVRSRMDEVRMLALDISAGIHALSHELHPSKLRHLGMVNAMRGFCMELSEQQDVEIAFGDNDVPKTLPPEISICLFRVLQEALHNAVKHSSVRHFEVEVRGASDSVFLTVRDSGVGFDPQSAMRGSGIGLTSMQERLKLVDGEISIDSRPNRGTAIHVRVPFGRANISAWAAQ